MPVQFKGSSEYKKNFKWTESFRSKSFDPSEEQAASRAGQASVSLSTTCEPPLQSKKRLEGPSTSLSTAYFETPSQDVEYALLGNTDKFAENVRYRPKPTFSQPGKIYKNKENFDDAPPPSKQLKMQKRIKPLTKERHPPPKALAQPAPAVQDSSSSAQISPPPAPRDSNNNAEVKAAHKDKNLKDVLGEPAPPETNDDPKKVSSMNEFVQTNMKKGVTVSAPEAPADYSLKYKAGVAPPRPVKKMSEYNRQFQWKDGPKASPLLAAEQVVYASQADLGPYKTSSLPKASEYQMQFQKWKLPDYSNEVNLQLAAKKSAENLPEKRKISIKRSKSVGTLQGANAESQATVTESSSQEILKDKLSKSHGKIKRMGSEYRANFKAPLSYSCNDGAWRGAPPPQLTPDAEQNANNNAATEDSNNNNNAEPLSNWFAEVVELRRRAQEYRKRAQGTHFSREHLVQLMARESAAWDVQSGASDTVRALDLEAAAPAGIITPIQKPSVASVSGSAVSDAVSMEEEEQIVDDIEVKEVKKTKKKKGASKGGKDRVSRKMAWIQEQKDNVEDQIRNLEVQQEKAVEEAQDEDLADLKAADGEAEGRLPTPVLKVSNSAPRHHLDLTTPAIGGALLTAPPTGGSKIIMTSRSGDSYVTMSDELPPPKPQKTYTMDKLITMATSGKPSIDTHLLRDEDAESDRALVTQYISSLPVLSDDDKENKVQKTKTSKSKKAFLNIEDIRVQTGKGPAGGDDDVMSVVSLSMQSVASSGSLASQVLERAKQRSKFWTDKK